MKTVYTTHLITVDPYMTETLESLRSVHDESYDKVLAAAYVKDKFWTPIIKVVDVTAACGHSEGDREAPKKYIARFKWTLEDSDDEEAITQAIRNYLSKYPDTLSGCKGFFIKCEPYSEQLN